MKQRTAGNLIAARHQNGNILYVQQVPGDGGKDWGYTLQAANALPLNKYFARRFVADSRHVKADFHIFVQPIAVQA